MRILSFLPLAVFAASVAAQTATLRGKVEDVQGTQNQFFLDGTNLPLVSTALNLNTLVGQQAIMQVVDIGTPAAPLIRVDSSVPTTKVMDMGNLRLGQSSTFGVNAPAGSAAFMFMDFQDNTGFLPVGGLGTWLLGLSPFLLAGGITDGQNQFQAQFFTPPNPQLLGLRITSQALVGDHGTWFFSNPDNKTVEQ
ncbi:MAG TPA: hypothetical protein VFT55_08640 [Planctomycetota bacterium]|nr:hypothetical protein [Planctomycetota bacterium]